MSDCDSLDSSFEFRTSIDQTGEDTSHYSPIPTPQLSDTESGRSMQQHYLEGAGSNFEENPQQYIVPDVKPIDKPKRKFLRKGEGTARFSPGAKARAKPVTKQPSIPMGREDGMKRVVANRTANSIPKPHQKITNHISHGINTSPQHLPQQSKGISPIPFTPPSYMKGTPVNTKMHEFQTPPFSTEIRPGAVGFKTEDEDKFNPGADPLSRLFRVSSNDSVLQGIMRNDIQQQEDLREFEALEALIEAHVNGDTSFDLDLNAPMDSPAFHALGERAKQFTKKQPVSVPNLMSPLSVANSSAYQNPLNEARFEDDEGWTDALEDNLHDFRVVKETKTQLPENCMKLPPIPYNATNYRSNCQEEVAAPKENSGEISTLLQERVEELENEITEYQRLNARLRKEEEEKKRISSEYKQKVDEFEEYKRSELDRMEKDYQNQMLVVKRERQRLEQYKQAHQTSESKLLKQEIDNLREQLSEMQGILREKETKHKSIVQRLKDNIRQVEFERDESKEQNKLLESIRLTQWESKADKVTSNSGHARTKLNFEKVKSDSPEELSWAQSEVMEESTQIFSDSSSESTHEEQIQPISSPNTVNETDSTEASKSYINSTPILAHADKLSERILPDKPTEIIYFNNTRKLISPNGKMVTLYLSNGDIKTMSEDKTVYFFAENGTKQTKYTGGKEIFEYSTGQREIMNTDGSKEMFFPDGNKAILFADGSEKVTYKDGTVRKKTADGNKTVIWNPSGFVDTLTTEYKKRDFDDGTCKIVFKDGTNETRYPSGRVRIKNAKGEVIHDEYMEK